jgi:hypothetical protein
MARFGGLFHLCQRIPNPFEKNVALTMRYTISGAHHQASAKIPRHKTGTKRHKFFDEVSVSFASKLRASGRDDCSDD